MIEEVRNLVLRRLKHLTDQLKELKAEHHALCSRVAESEDAIHKCEEEMRVLNEQISSH
jgi:chromosome segregation ATPase